MTASINRRQFVATAMTATTAIAAASLAVPSALQAAKHPDRGIVGRQAPELNVRYWIDGAGKETEFSLAQQRGKFVFIKCWQAWCPGCHSHGFPALQRIAGAFENEPKVQTIAIQTTFEGFSSNVQSKLREMQLRYELPIVMGHDDGQDKPNHRPTTMTNYRTGGTPWMILIDPNGAVLFDGFSINPELAIQFLSDRVANMA